MNPQQAGNLDHGLAIPLDELAAWAICWAARVGHGPKRTLRLGRDPAGASAPRSGTAQISDAVEPSAPCASRRRGIRLTAPASERRLVPASLDALGNFSVLQRYAPPIADRRRTERPGRWRISSLAEWGEFARSASTQGAQRHLHAPLHRCTAAPKSMKSAPARSAQQASPVVERIVLGDMTKPLPIQEGPGG